MTGINALSTKGVISTEDGSSFTGSSQPEVDSTAMMFAAIFGGWLNQIGGQGQDSGNQSNEPAGKEANSGRHALLGLDGLQGLIGILQGNEDIQEALGQGKQGANSELDILMTQLDKIRNQNAPSNPQGILEDGQLSGMTGQPLGDTPQSELDLYKNVISNLLKEMSGELKVKGHNQGDLNSLTQQKSEIAAQRYNSGLFLEMGRQAQPIIAMTDTEAPNVAVTNVEDLDVAIADVEVSDVAMREVKALNTAMASTAMTDSAKTRGNSIVEANQSTLFAALLGKSISEENKAMPREANVVEGSKNSEALRLTQENSEDTLLKQETAKSISSPGLAEDKPAEDGVVLYKDTYVKGTQEKEQSADSNKVSKSTITDITTEANLLQQTREVSQVQGKITEKSEQPIWTQVARDIFEKAYLARPQLRELTIQLHPAHLGEINISMSWEEGQVHLRMVASDSGTGQILQSNLAELRDNLTQLGIQCGQMEMGLGGQKEGAQEHQGQQGSAHSQESTDETLEFLNGGELEKMLDSEEPIPGINRINVKA